MMEVACTHNRVTLRGHADYAPRGQDIVCAAASALVYALVGTLEQTDNVRELVIRPGFVTVAVQRADKAMDMAQCGLAQLAGRYPQCVQLRQTEEGGQHGQ